MCASQLSTILFLFTIHGVSADGAYGTSCAAAPLKGFAALKDGALVDGAGEPFVFASMNLPNIHRIELPEGGVRKPTLAEVADGLCSVQQMKGRVARTYVLSHGDGDLYHIDGGTVNEGWFAVLDQVIEVAEQLGVYVIIPFVNTFWRAAPRNSARNSAAAQFCRALLRRPVRHRLRRYEHWGTTAYYAQWSGQDPSKSIDFFHDETQQAVFRGVLTAVLERVNSRTGRQYKDEPAILAWETGNELVDVRYGAAQFGAILCAILRNYLTPHPSSQVRRRVGRAAARRVDRGRGGAPARARRPAAHHGWRAVHVGVAAARRHRPRRPHVRRAAPPPPLPPHPRAAPPHPAASPAAAGTTTCQRRRSRTT